MTKKKQGNPVTIKTSEKSHTKRKKIPDDIPKNNIKKKKEKKPSKQSSNSGLISQTRNLLSYKLKPK